MNDRQARYDERYQARMERDRPQPQHELGELLRLAHEAVGDVHKLSLWWVTATPKNVIDALEADAWDRANPYYVCIACHDGKDLPPGYMCRVCGEDNPS